MASIRERRRTNGTVGYTVAWRLGGTRTGHPESETFDTRREAQDFRLDVQAAGHQWPEGWVKGVGYVRVAPVVEVPPPQEHRLLDFGTRFVRSRTAIGPDTRTLYSRHIGRMDAWLTPIVDGLPMVETLTNDHVRAFVNAREAAGAAPKTIRNYHGLLFSVMEYAIAQELREGNPCGGTRLPEPADIDDDEQMTFLTEDEMRLLLDCLGDDPVARDMAEVAVGTGLRFGELTALQVRDLIEHDGRLRIAVRRAWKNNGRGEFALAGHGPRYLGKPKSGKSRRRVSTAPVIAKVLRRYAVGKEPTDFLFTGVSGGPIEEHFTDRRWAKAVRLARTKGLYKTPRFHDLRHTHASWLISAGVPLPVIQRRLGHDSIKTTVDIYGGLLDQAQEAADDAIEAALVGGRIPSPTGNRLLVVAADANFESEPGVDDYVAYDVDDDALPEIDTDVA